MVNSYIYYKGINQKCIIIIPKQQAGLLWTFLGVKGVEGSNPFAPTVLRVNSNFELTLCHIKTIFGPYMVPSGPRNNLPRFYFLYIRSL